MSGRPLKFIFPVILLLLFFLSSAWAAPFTTQTPADVLAAPAAGMPKVASLSQGAIVEVTHQAGSYWRVELSDGKTGYVPASSLQQAKTKGGPLIPIVVAAGAPILKVVVSKVVGWFKKLFGIDDSDMAKADQMISVGKELIVLAKEVGGWLKVKTPDGKIGYIKESPQVVYLQPVTYANKQVAGIWKNSEPIPQTATGLTLQVEVRKIDGTPVPSGGTLKLGEEYRIYITPSSDCWVRITCETPDFNHACQYYPNQFPGTQTSIKFQGGRTYSVELLPSGVNFKVSEPIGAKDILRVEATTAGPYHNVSAGDGCAPTVKFKGGGFSAAGNVTNPTAQVVVEYSINTVK